MKFILNEPISYDEIQQAILTYLNENHGHQPAYILVHPSSRRNILISSGDDMKGLTYHVMHHTVSAEHGIKSSPMVCGLYLIKTEDVEPGFMIICG